MSKDVNTNGLKLSEVSREIAGYDKVILSTASVVTLIGIILSSLPNLGNKTSIFQIGLYVLSLMFILQYQHIIAKGSIKYRLYITKFIILFISSILFVLVLELLFNQEFELSETTAFISTIFACSVALLLKYKISWILREYLKYLATVDKTLLGTQSDIYEEKPKSKTPYQYFRE